MRSFLVNARLWICLLTDQLLIGEALSGDLGHGQREAVQIVDGVAFPAAIVEAEHLLIEVAEEMEGFDADVGSVDAALEAGPEVLDSVGVNIAIDVLLGVIDDAVLRR